MIDYRAEEERINHALPKISLSTLFSNAYPAFRIRHEYYIIFAKNA